MTAKHLDVVIVGAGISGIASAYHLQKHCRDRTFTIIEGRENLGGTWDLFRYPGIRSDSDMYTLGFAFKPWKDKNAIASGDAILDYLNETVDENNLRDKIRFGYKVLKADWSPNTARWSVEILKNGSDISEVITCNFLHMCSGYYNYDEGYLPDFKGIESFKGRIVHPQKWTSDVDYKDKRVIVIGSGATAVTLVPEMAKDAKHVVMLQRSPSYVVSRPAQDKIALWLRKFLPNSLAYKITRAKNVLLTIFFYNLARKRPDAFKKRLIEMVEEQLGPDYDVKKHFTPSYKPWDQRVCAVPDADIFDAIKNGSASVVTDHIQEFTETGILLKSGDQLDADLIIPATGLRLQSLGGIALTVDRKKINISDHTNYKGLGLNGVPNFAWTVGYTNASWTLKADLTADYVCRILNHMKKHDYTTCVPELDPAYASNAPLMDFTSGYIQRSLDQLPKQGSRPPWQNHQNYISDLIHMKFGKIDDGVMQFSKAA